MSPRTTPDAASVPVLTFDPVVAWSISSTVPPVYAAVANVTAVSFGPLAPTWSVPVVPRPVLLMVVDAIVPSVFVPVEDVKPVANVDTPRMFGIVAVLIVAVLIVAVLMVAVLMVAVLIVDVPTLCVPTLNVPIVAVPVEAVIVDPNVTGPKRLLLLETVNEPVLLTPEVDKDNAEDVSSPSVITCKAPSIPPVVNVLRSCAKLLLMVCVPSVGI
jgi:hypothetical protein